MSVSLLHNNNNQFFTPNRIGFIASLLLHIFFLYLIIDKFHHIQIAENGASSITLSLATIQNPSKDEAEPKPVPPKPKKHHKKHKPKTQKAPNPIPEEVVEETQESLMAHQANEQNYGDMIQTIAKNDGEHNELYRQIEAAISKKQNYPNMMRKRRIEGEVLVEFVIYTDGRVDHIRIVQPSKYEDFNKASLQAVRDASKHFPKVPNNVRLEIILEYNMRRET